MSNVASRAARPAICVRAAPRARINAVSARRCSVSSMAMSSNAYTPSTTISSTGVSNADLPTRSARVSRSTNPSILVLSCPVPARPTSSGSDRQRRDAIAELDQLVQPDPGEVRSDDSSRPMRPPPRNA